MIRSSDIGAALLGFRFPRGERPGDIRRPLIAGPGVGGAGDGGTWASKQSMVSISSFWGSRRLLVRVYYTVLRYCFSPHLIHILLLDNLHKNFRHAILVTLRIAVTLAIIVRRIILELVLYPPQRGL